MQWLRTSAAAAALAAGLVTGAHAHAFLDNAEPKVGSTVSAAPEEIRLQFTQPVEALLSSIELRGPNGDVDLGEATTPERDHSILVAQVHGRMAEGAYRVLWHVVSVDTHKTQGDFTFEYRP
jgi:copper resistance protein C